MGASQRKEAVTYFSDVAVANVHPQEGSFIEHLVQYHRGMCSGVELYGVAQPIVEKLLRHARETHRVQWLFEVCFKLLDQAVCNGAGNSEEALLAAIQAVELVIRHTYHLCGGKSIALLDLLDGEHAVVNGRLTAQVQSHAPSPTEAPCVGSPPIRPHGGNAGIRLCGLLVDYIVKTPYTANSLIMHLCVTRLLLTMTSSALHHPTSFDESHKDAFTEMILSSDILDLFLTTLLHRIVEWGAGIGPKSPLLYTEGHQPSLRNLYSWFSRSQAVDADAVTPRVRPAVGHSTRRNDADLVQRSCSAGEQVGRHSAALISVLVAHHKGCGPNPALAFIQSLKDGERVQFKLLLVSLLKRLPECPVLCLLLYVLLYDHPTFLKDMLSSDAHLLLDLMHQLLWLTYDVSTETETVASMDPSPHSEKAVVEVEENPLEVNCLGGIMRRMILFSHPFIIFMTSTLLLLLSQNRILNERLCDTVVEPIFRLESYSSKLSLGSLYAVVVSLAIRKALRERNEPMAAVFGPCLVNMAPFLRDMEPYTAQRLLALLLLLLRRIRHCAETYAAASKSTTEEVINVEQNEDAVPHGGIEGSGEDPQVLQSVSAMSLRQLQMVMEAIESMLRGPECSNVALLYELLYHHERIIKCLSFDDASPLMKQTTEIMSNVLELIRTYESAIAHAPQASSASQILDLLRQVSHKSELAVDEAKEKVSTPSTGTSSVVSMSELIYTYEESSQSYDFFGPFVWSTLLSDARRPGGILWGTAVKEFHLFPQ